MHLQWPHIVYSLASLSVMTTMSAMDMVVVNFVRGQQYTGAGAGGVQELEHLEQAMLDVVHIVGLWSTGLCATYNQKKEAL